MELLQLGGLFKSPQKIPQQFSMVAKLHYTGDKKSGHDLLHSLAKRFGLEFCIKVVKGERGILNFMTLDCKKYLNK